MKSCPQCQYPNPDTRKECFKCGVPLDGSVLPKEQTPQPVAESPFAQPGPYSGPGQPPPGYQSPNSSYSTPVVLPQVRHTPVNRGLWTGLAVILLCLGLWGFRFISFGNETKRANDGVDPQNYTIVSLTLEPGGFGMAQVKGQLCNNTSWNVRMATVVVDILDASGKKIGKVSDFTTEWSPNENWIFEASVMDPAAAGVQINKVKANYLK